MGEKEEKSVKELNKKLGVVLIVLLVVLALVYFSKQEEVQSPAEENKTFPVEKINDSSEERYKIVTYQNPDGTFTCQDGTIVQNADECLDRAIDQIMQQRVDTEGKNILKITVMPNDDGTYTCSEGSVVFNPDECAEIVLSKIQELEE